MEPSSTASDLFERQGKQKKSHQFKALFLKSATLQSKQLGTNICQILTPIICLLFTYLIKVIATDNLNVQQDEITFGIPLNFPVMAFPEVRDRININCLQWYEFQSSEKDKYIGLDLERSLGTRMASPLRACWATPKPSTTASAGSTIRDTRTSQPSTTISRLRSFALQYDWRHSERHLPQPGRRRSHHLHQSKRLQARA